MSKKTMDRSVMSVKKLLPFFFTALIFGTLGSLLTLLILVKNPAVKFTAKLSRISAPSPSPKSSAFPFTSPINQQTCASAVVATTYTEVHEGIDIGGSESCIIHAAAPGTVLFAGRDDNYGNMVIIDHGNGYTSLYAHGTRLQVKTGDKVLGNQPLMNMGSSGRSTSIHLHFELRHNSENIDPQSMISFR